MKALTVLRPGEIVYEDVEAPKPTGTMLKIRVLRAGICATDFSIYTGESSFIKSGEITYPVRFGHEYSGVVEEVGESVTDFQPGDRVFSDNAVSCGKCPACRQGRYGDCAEIRSVGTVNCWDGCFAEYIYMPQRHVYHIPGNLGFDDAALFEPASISLACFDTVRLNPDMTAAVIGTGAIGMSAVLFAKYYGAGKVIAVGRNDGKLAVAKAIGADETINSAECDLTESLLSLTAGRGTDMLIEASGSPSALYAALNATAKKGIVSLPAFYERNLNEFPIDHLVLRQLTLRGAAGGFGNPRKVAKILSENNLSLTSIITHRIKFSDARDFFANPGAWPRDKIKIMIEFD